MARTKTKAPEVTAEDVAEAFANANDLLAQYRGDGTSAAVTHIASKSEVEEEEDEIEEGDAEAAADLLEKVNDLKIVDLRKSAAKLGIDDKKKADIIAALEEMVEDSDDEEDEDDEEEESEYAELSLADLRKEVRARVKSGEIEATPAEIKKADQDELIEMLEAADEEEDEDEDEEGDEEEEEFEEITEDSLKEMSLTELKELAGEMEIKVRVPKTAKTEKAKKAVYVDAILEEAEEEE